MFGNAEIPPIDETWTMCPDPCSRRNGSAAWVTHMRAEDVRLHLLAELLLAELLDEPELAVARVVDHDVQPAEVLVRLGDGCEVGLAVGHVELQRQHGVAVLRDQVVERGGVAGRRGDPVAALQRGDRPLAAEAARAAGDEPGLLCHGLDATGLECTPGQADRRREQRDALDVVGHREQVEGAQPLAAGSRARRRSRRRGRARPGRRRRTPRPAARGRRPARRPSAWRPRAAGRGRPGRTARRTPRASTRSTGPGRDLGARVAQVDCGVLARRAVPLDRDDPRAGPDRVGEEPGEQPDAGVQVEHRLPRLRARGSRARSRPGPAAPRGAPARSRRRRPRSRGRAAEYDGGVRRLEQAVVDRDHVVRAVLAHARAGRRAASTYRCRVRQRSPSTSPGTASTDHVQVEPGQPGQLLADHRRP